MNVPQRFARDADNAFGTDIAGTEAASQIKRIKDQGVEVELRLPKVVEPCLAG